VYIPLDVMAKHGYTVDELFRLQFRPAFAEVMREICGVARELFEQGMPLPKMLDRRLALDITLFSRGGVAILDKIERQGYNVLAARPRISKIERAGILLGTLFDVALHRAA
jgi:phytoene/squalene synthetase